MGLVMAGCAALALIGCDTSVDAFEASDRRFSVIGLIDAGRDTQFVRVARLTDSTAFGAPNEPLAATVTTEHLASGETATWHDSLFAIRTVAGGQTTTRYVHNVWTAADFQPGESYRFTVTEGDPATAATATVTIPEPFQDAIIIPPDNFPEWSVRVEGVRHMIDLLVLIRQRTRSGAVEVERLSFIADTTRFNLVPYTLGVRIRSREISRRIDGELIDVRAQVVVGNENWPDTGDLSAEELLQPELYTSVENGPGFLYGALSQTYPMCRTPESPLTGGFDCRAVGLGP
jgi:hypothetical protein